MSVDRKILILRVFAKGPQKIEELVEQTKIPQSSVYRITNKLIAEGTIQRLLGRFALTTSGRQKYAGQLKVNQIPRESVNID